MSGLGTLIIIIVSFLILFFVFVVFIYLIRFKRVPRDKALVIWGRSTGTDKKGLIVVNGGGRFVWPIVQDYSYISRGPWNVKVILRNVQVRGSKDPFLVNVEAGSHNGINFINPTEGALETAAKNLLGKDEDEIIVMIKPYLENALRKVLVELNEDTIRNWPEVEEWVTVEAQKELLRIGLEVRHVCINDLFPSNLMR